MTEIMKVYYSIVFIAVLVARLTDVSIGNKATIPYYDTRTAELGHIEENSKEYNKKDGTYMGIVESNKLVLDGTGEGSRKINKFIEERFAEESKMIDEFLTNKSFCEDESLFEFRIEMRDISYMDDEYCSIAIEGYHDFGGAHGIRFMEYYVFNRKTGEQLQLKDIVGNSVGKLKKIIGKAFREIDENDFTLKLPEETITRIEKKANYHNMKFYLSEEGVHFYFAPYEVTSYVGGFPEAMVPYEKLEMKINIPK